MASSLLLRHEVVFDLIGLELSVVPLSTPRQAASCNVRHLMTEATKTELIRRIEESLAHPVYSYADLAALVGAKPAAFRMRVSRALEFGDHLALPTSVLVPGTATRRIFLRHDIAVWLCELRQIGMTKKLAQDGAAGNMNTPIPLPRAVAVAPSARGRKRKGAVRTSMTAGLGVGK